MRNPFKKQPTIPAGKEVMDLEAGFADGRIVEIKITYDANHAADALDALGNLGDLGRLFHMAITWPKPDASLEARLDLEAQKHGHPRFDRDEYLSGHYDDWDEDVKPNESGDYTVTPTATEV